MPADPIRAVFWFVVWGLKVLVRFFWLLILIGVVYESWLNGLVGGVVTLFIGLVLWLLLAIVLRVVAVTLAVSTFLRLFEPIGRPLETHEPEQTFLDEEQASQPLGRVVEGSIVDLDEKRRERNR